MVFLIIFIATVILGVCFAQGKKRDGFLAVALAILCFPIWVILALAKKYK